MAPSPAASGRSPAYRPTTSAGPSGTSSAADARCSSSSSSAAEGTGSSAGSPGASTSVRPIATSPSPRGIANTQRPRSPGTFTLTTARGSPSRSARISRCEPRLGRSVTASVSEFVQTPAATITRRARTEKRSPVRPSTASTPSSRRPVTSEYVSTWAPCAAAVRATATTRRASSSSWQSQLRTAPRSPAGRRAGASRRASSALTRRGGGSARRLVRAALRSPSPIRPPTSSLVAAPRSTAVSSGIRKGRGRIRCGATWRSSVPRSTADSQARPTSPCSR